MPEYSYVCKNCEHSFDAIQRMSEATHEHQCPECKGLARRMFKPHRIAVFHDYVTSDISGEPIHIKSTGHEKEVCRQHGVVHATSDDMTGWKKPKPAPLPSMKDSYLQTKQEMGL